MGKIKVFKEDFNCSLCGEILVLAGLVQCSPFYIINVFEKDKTICKHCYKRLKKIN